MRKMNQPSSQLRLRPGTGKTCKVFLVALAAASILSFSSAMAGTDSKDMKEITPPTCTNTEKDWTLELGSGVTWSNVRSGQPNQAYTIVPISLTASLRLDDVSHFQDFWGIFNGYTEFFFRGDYGQIVHGPENHYEGLMV